MKHTLCLLLSFATLALATPEKVESIAAVVDGKVIFMSDVMQAVIQSQSTPGFAKLDPKAQQLQVLQSMIDEKVVLSRADRDSIVITDDEIRSRVDQHIQMIASRQKMDAKALEQAIRAQTGMNMTQYREQLSTQMHDQMLMGKIRQRHIGVVEPTRKEVEKFYEQYRDSLPVQYNSIHVSHLQIKIEPDSLIVDSVRTLAKRLVDSLDQGIAWEVLAKRHSQDSSASRGGSLGYFRKGTLEPEYERAAWRLDLGQYTDSPVKTRFGWHLIRILGKKDDEIQTAQILLRTVPSALDSFHTHNLADSLRNLAQKGENFVALAKKFSSDQETSWKGGSLGWMERSELDSTYQNVIAGLDAGAISEPILIDDSWHIFRLDEARPSRSLTLEDDYAKIAEFAANMIGNAKLQKLTERWRKEVYIDIRLSRN